VISHFVPMNKYKIELKVNFSLKPVLNHIPEDFKIKTKICSVINNLNNKKLNNSHYFPKLVQSRSLVKNQLFIDVPPAYHSTKLLAKRRLNARSHDDKQQQQQQQNPICLCQFSYFRHWQLVF
jgi:hypothetical protein